MKVAVIGAGAIGSQTAWHLAREGAAPVVFDRFGIPNAWGAHDGESRLLRSVPYLETAPGDRKILADSMTAWHEFQAQTPRHLLTVCGGLIIDQPTSPAFQVAAEASLLRPDVRRLDHAALTDAYPQFALDHSEHGIIDGSGGLADPQEAVAAAVELAVEAGAQVRPMTQITACRGRDGGVELDIEGHGTELFDRVVLAAGAFARGLVPSLPIRARRLLLGWYPARAGEECWVPGMPSFVWTPPEGGFLYGGPAEGGSTVKVGIDAAWGETNDPLLSRTVTASDIAPMREVVREKFPWLDADRGRYEMHIDGWSIDERGVLGELPECPGVIIATGWSGHGFKISPVIGKLAADLVLDRDPGYDISHLDPARFG